MRKPRRPLLKSFLALLLCLSLLIGSTFAWFTDSVTSSGNIIKSGNLDVEMYWSDRLLSVDSPEWQNADGVPVFDYSNWEPGYTQVRYVKISNEGNLALKWLLSIETEAQLGTIAEVIDVYYINPVSSAITSLDGLTPVGILKDVIAGHSSTSGALLPKSAQGGNTAILAIAFHMQESAGNDYMSQSTGAFTLKLLATQLQYESDSFDNTYDKEATWPNSIPTGSVSAPVTPAADGTVANDLTMANNAGTLSATVPAGTKLADGVSELTFSVSNMENGANISIADGEEKWSLDVHVEGVAEDNDKPILIAINEALPKGLNLGNYTLYHVENGTPVAMTQVSDAAALVDHNQFTYDPATGNVILSMKSFSEIALVAAESSWNGNLDYSWYDADATELTIANADQLAALSAIVGGMKKVTGRTDKVYSYSNEVIQDSFAGKTITLAADININDIHADGVDASENGIVFYPIGYYNSEGTYEKSKTKITSGFKTFQGTFDGNGHTIKNFYQNTWEMKGDHDWYAAEDQHYRDGMGLFGKVYGGTVKNLTVDNFSSDGEIATTGTIAAYADCGAVFENISIKNCNPRVYNIGNGGIVGCVGWYANDDNAGKVIFRHITVDNTNKISALWGSWDVACGGIVGQYYPTSGQENAIKNPGIYFDDCHISAQIDVNNDVCANYQYYAYRYAGMIIGSIRENTTNDKGQSVPKMDGITALGCTVNYGTWNNYYYCELVANSLASYTHDHQMSRLTQVSSVDVENKTYTTLEGKTVNIGDGTYNLVTVNGAHATKNATCYHFVNGVQHKHEDAGEETVGEELVLKEDKQHLYLPFNQLFTGYGWGVSSVGLDNYNGFLNVTLGSDASVEKFVSRGVTQVKVGTAVSLSALFKKTADINNRGVWVTVEADANNTNTVNYTFVPNITDWTKSTLKFEGLGKVYVTIQDYDFCTPTTISLEVVESVAANTSVAFSTPDSGGFATVTSGDNANTVVYQTVADKYPDQGDWQRRLQLNITDTNKEVVKFNFVINKCEQKGDYTGARTPALLFKTHTEYSNDTDRNDEGKVYGHFVILNSNGDAVNPRNLTAGMKYTFYGLTQGNQVMTINPGTSSEGGTVNAKKLDIQITITDWELLDYEPEIELTRTTYNTAGQITASHAYQGNAAPYQDKDGNWMIHYRSFTGVEHHNNTAEYRSLQLNLNGDYEAVSFEFKFNTSQYQEIGHETYNETKTLIDFAGLPAGRTFFYNEKGGAVSVANMSTGQWYRAVILEPAESTTIHVMGHKNGDPNGVLDRNGDKVADNIKSYVYIDMDFRNLQTTNKVVVSSRDSNDAIVTHTGGDTYKMTTTKQIVNYATDKYRTTTQCRAVITAPSRDHNRLAVDFKFNSVAAYDDGERAANMTVWRATSVDSGVSMWIYDMETGEMVDSGNKGAKLTVGKWYTLVIENPADAPQTAYQLCPCRYNENGTGDANIEAYAAVVDIDFANPRVIS